MKNDVFLTLKKRGKSAEKASLAKFRRPKPSPPCAYGNCVMWPIGSDTKNNHGRQGNISYRVLRPQSHHFIANIRSGSINWTRPETPFAQQRLVLYGAWILKIQLQRIAALPPNHAALLRHYFTTIGYVVGSPASSISYSAARLLNFSPCCASSKSKSVLEGFCARPQSEAREDTSRGR